MAGIFISYRREDAAPWAGRVYERLSQDFQRDQIFMDVDNIAPGLDFVEELEQQVGRCSALLAIIGKGWADARNAKGERRLDDPHDFVRIEVEAALQRGVRVIPVLVDGAAMPSAGELPDILRPLARRNAVELTHSRFGSDVLRLVGALLPIVKTEPLQPRVEETVQPIGPAPIATPQPRVEEIVKSTSTATMVAEPVELTQVTPRSGGGWGLFALVLTAVALVGFTIRFGGPQLATVGDASALLLMLGFAVLFAIMAFVMRR